MSDRCNTLFRQILFGEGKKKKLRTGAARGSSSGVAMPNPLIKWGKRNMHSDPPHPLGAIKVAATSPTDTPTQSKKEE